MKNFERSARLVLVVVGALFLLASPAAAQQFGVRAGASAEPDQFYVGVHAETRPIADNLRFRPNMELGFGDDATLIALNFEFVYPFDITKSSWQFYPGIGPALNIYNFEDDTHANGGLNFLLGIQHRTGLFFELKIGAIDSPDLKFAIGYTFKK